MKQKQLNQLSQELLSPVLFALGFQVDRETYFRELPSNVIHLLSHELDPRTTETFRVMCGVCTRRISWYSESSPRDMGYVGAQHLTPDGWHYNSGHWPCSDEQEARTSFEKITAFIPTVVEPWFKEFQTLSSVAAKMDTQNPRQGLEKAKLYVADGDLTEAEATLGEFIKRLESPKSWDDPKEIAALKEQAESLLREITSESDMSLSEPLS